METTIYIIKDGDAYRFGFDSVIWLFEPDWVSQAWIRKVKVLLPEEFEVAYNYYQELCIFRDGEAYELGVDKDDNPVIIDHKNNGSYLPLKILSEGWDL